MARRLTCAFSFSAALCDGFSIGGNHLHHGARKNINLTYVIMDNFSMA